MTDRLDGNLNTETLEVDDNGKDQNGCHDVHQVGEVLAVEGLSQSANLVGSRGQQVEQRNDCSFEFSA